VNNYGNTTTQVNVILHTTTLRPFPTWRYFVEVLVTVRLKAMTEVLGKMSHGIIKQGFVWSKHHVECRRK
jgi:hypothetical protein